MVFRVQSGSGHHLLLHAPPHLLMHMHLLLLHRRRVSRLPIRRRTPSFYVASLSMRDINIADPMPSPVLLFLDPLLAARCCHAREQLPQRDGHRGVLRPAAGDCSSARIGKTRTVGDAYTQCIHIYTMHTRLCSPTSRPQLARWATPLILRRRALRGCRDHRGGCKQKLDVVTTCTSRPLPPVTDYKINMHLMQVYN